MIKDTYGETCCRENCVKILGKPQVKIDKKNNKTVIDIYAHLSREINLEDLGHVYVIVRIYENTKLVHEELIEPVPGTDYIGEDIELGKTLDPRKLFIELIVVNK